MGRTTNYDNRRVSLNIYSNLFNYGSDRSQPANTSLNSDTGGMVCAGIVKLCQSVLVLLLSDRVYFDQTWGTRLPRMLRGNAQVLTNNIQSTMQEALYTVKSQLRANQRENAPADETLAGLKLLNVDIDFGRPAVMVNIRVFSLAGDRRDLVVPINLPV